MSALVLTAVLAVVWAGCVALGWWRGGWREVVALGGILLAYAVLSEWAAPNGRDLTSQFGGSLARNTTTVALLYLIGGAALIGYLGGHSLPRPMPLSPRERGFGAALGFLNGAVLLACALRVLRAYAFAPSKGRMLHDSPLARFLIEGIGYLLLPALLIGAAFAVLGFVQARRPIAPAEAQLVEPAYTSAGAPAPAAFVLAPNDPSPPTDEDAPFIDWPAQELPIPAARARANVDAESLAALLPTRPAPPRAALPPAWATLPLPPKPNPPPSPRRMPASPDIVSRTESPAPVPPTPPGLPPGHTYAPPPAHSPAPPPAVPPTLPPAEHREGGQSVALSAHPPTPAATASPSTPPRPPPPMPFTIPGRVETAVLSPPKLTTRAVAPPLVASPPPGIALSPPGPPLEGAAPPAAPSSVRLRSAYARVATARQVPVAAPLDLSPPVQSGPHTHPCSTCGDLVRNHARFCPHCGAPQLRR